MLRAKHAKMHTIELMKQDRIPLFKPNHITVEELELLLIEAKGNIKNVKMSMDTFKKKCRELNFDYIAVCKRIGARAYKNMPTLKEFVDVYGELHGDKFAIINRFKFSEYKYNAYLRACDISTNHMVQSVTYAGEFDVYDIEVEGYHNFIANEICVHNSAEPNMQNIPSRANDIRHIFRATPGYILLSSDYSQQEPKLTAYVSQDPNMIKSFQENKDIYSFIAAIAFNKSYEECQEFTPNGEYNPEGKARRTEAKSVVLGILYGRSIPSIADQLYSHEDWSNEKKVKQAQYVYDSVLNAFPALREFMVSSQSFARKHGYVETILGRRRHIPDMTLPDFEFVPMTGYVNPDIDPLDINTLNGGNEIPKRIQEVLYKELTSYKYFGQVAKRIKQLAENEHIKVINNRFKIQEASFNPNAVENPVVKVISPDQVVGIAAQVQNDELSFPIVALTRNEDTPIDTDRMNFTRAHKGVASVLDTETNELYYEKAIPIKLSYDLTILTTNTADRDELIKELIFKYADMYFLTLTLPYYCKRKIRFGITINTDSDIKNSSGNVEYIEGGKLYQSIIPLRCEGCVLVSYTASKLKRTQYEVEATLTNLDK